jgi:hypothetical protein
MGVEIAIAGSTVTPSLGGLTFEQTLGSRHLCSIQWDDPTGTGLHPALGDEVIATDSSGGRAFGGLVGSVRESGLTKASIVALTREVTAYDFGGLCDQRVVTANWSSATLKTVLLDLTSDYLSTFGVSLSTSQPTGPNMGELSYDYRVLTDVLNDLQTRSGYAWNLSYDKVLLLSTAGTRTAPAAINSTNRVALQIEWEQTIENYANRQYISYGPSGDQIIDDYWTATTGQTAFPLHYSDVQAYWVVTENGVYWPVGVYGVDAMRWTWDAASTTLYSTGSTGGTVVLFHIQVPFPQITYADAAAHSTNPYERVNTLSALADGTDYAAAQALAAAQLTAVGDGTVKRVRFVTNQSGFQVGQVVTITLPDRHLSGAHLITSVIGSHDPETAERIRYEVECVSGDYSQGTFLDTYRQWGGSAGTGAGVVIGGGVSSTGGAAGLHAHLGGSRTVLIASTAWTPIEDYQTFTAPVTGTYIFRTERAAETTGVTAQVRLWDITSTAAVTGSESTASASTGWLEATVSVSLVAGYQYRAEWLGDSATLGAKVGQATVEL